MNVAYITGLSFYLANSSVHKISARPFSNYQKLWYLSPSLHFIVVNLTVMFSFINTHYDVCINTLYMINWHIFVKNCSYLMNIGGKTCYYCVDLLLKNEWISNLEVRPSALIFFLIGIKPNFFVSLIFKSYFTSLGVFKITTFRISFDVWRFALYLEPQRHRKNFALEQNLN